MKYRTKLFLVLVGLTLLTNGLLITVFYHDASIYLRDQMAAKALSIAAAAAAGINGDELASLHNKKDMTSPLYASYEKRLRQIRDANRREDTYIKYIFTVMAAPHDPQKLLFGVDAEEAGPDKSALGDSYDFKTAQPYRLDQATAHSDLVEDQWGKWLEAHAPIYNSRGEVVGALVVDIDNKRVIQHLQHLLYAGLFALGLAVLLALVLAFFLARRVTHSLDIIGAALRRIAEGDMETVVHIKSRDEFATLGTSINQMVLGLRQRDNLKTSLTRYVSSQVAEKIIETGNLPEVQGERRKITVLFCDVRNFTTLAERLAPETIVALLNEAFASMIDAIFQHSGMLDKFLGDGFMAIFGAPLHDDAQEEHAVRAALAMQTALGRLALKWQREFGIDFHMGIGIHTGVAIVGNIGSRQRMEYTAIGDTVNLAARLETATKELNTRILVSAETYSAIIGKFDLISLSPIYVKGREQAVQVYAVKDDDNT